MGWHEWPLMLFTVLGQISVGGFIVLGMALMSGRLDKAQEQRVLRNMFVIWVLMGIGFIASTLHLGSPFRAFNSLNRIGASGLSNEIAFGALFFAVGGFYWLLAVLGKMPSGLGRIWLLIGMVLGLGFIYAMVRVYQIETVPTWNNGYTLINFFITMFIGGPLLGYMLKRSACNCGAGALASISVIAFLISLASNLMQGTELAQTGSSVMQALTLVPDFGNLMALRALLVALGLALWVVPMVRGKVASRGALILGLALVFCGELVGRGIFYGLHLTVGVVYGG